jgi:beta-lactamase class A
VKRGAFVAGALAAGACARGANALPAFDLIRVTHGIPATTGFVVRTMGDGAAVAALRPHERFPAASVIKLAIMTAVYRAYDAGTAHPRDLVRTRAVDLIGGSEVLAGSPAGRAWSLDTLVKAMIHVSDNAASNTLITAFGMREINAAMQTAGMTSSRLARHFADVVPSWKRSENVVSPADVATLLFQIERGAREGIPTVASPMSCRAMIDVMLGNDDGTKIVRGLPPGTPCAHKTGEIDGTRNDAGIVDPFGDVPYVIVVLTRNVRDNTAANAGIAAITRRVDAALRKAG